MRRNSWLVYVLMALCLWLASQASGAEMAWAGDVTVFTDDDSAWDVLAVASQYRTEPTTINVCHGTDTSATIWYRSDKRKFHVVYIRVRRGSDAVPIVRRAMERINDQRKKTNGAGNLHGATAQLRGTESRGNRAAH